MRLPRKRWPMAALALGFAAAVCIAPVLRAAAAEPVAPAPAATPAAPAAAIRHDATAFSNGQISAAVEAVKRDPNLGGETTMRTLHWVKGKQTPPSDAPSWLVGFFSFLSNSAGLLLWVLGAVAVAITAVWVYRVMRMHAPEKAPRATAAPSQVLAMDIRPASLPDDIGAAALDLLAAGRVREALSLLYRGALSRAVHRLGVNIGESFTEGEVLRAVQTRLDARGIRYFADLVRVWRRAVYAGEAVPTEDIRPLCAEFRASLGGAAI